MLPAQREERRDHILPMEWRHTREHRRKKTKIIWGAGPSIEKGEEERGGGCYLISHAGKRRTASLPSIRREKPMN